MASHSSRKSSDPVFRSVSSSARSSAGFASASTAASSSFASSFASSHGCHHHRSASPTRVNLGGGGRLSSAVRSHALSRPNPSPTVTRRTCACSPTTHPGSFRCSFHRGFQLDRSGRSQPDSSPSNRLNMRRSAMTNSLVRIGTVEGDLVKRTLAALIRPNSHQQRRQRAFQPRPSRLSIMCNAGDL